MAAVKKYFEHLRDVEKKREEFKQKKIQEIEDQLRLQEEKRLAAYEAEFLEYDFLLRRDWFLDEDDILDLIWDISEETFQRIMENLNVYSLRVRTVLRSTVPQPKCSTNSSLTVRDISELDLYREQAKHVQSLLDKVDDLWIAYKKEHGLSRPDGEADAKYTELYESLQATKKQLDGEVNKPSKTYVAPSLRKKNVTPEVEKLQLRVTTIENEISNVQKEIELQEKIWDNDKKSHVFNKLLYSVC